MSQTAGPSNSTGNGTINTTDSSRSFPTSTSLGQSKKALFMDRFQVDYYHQTFLHYSGPLLKKKTITKAESYYYFILGLPMELKKWLEMQMPQEKKKKEDTLTISKIWLTSMFALT
ncbi:hypothetical protein L218DRAFT_951817 [Marasmius fiardii PR-910]|nr:hypothetical protein L218DRAFT_951817 [Marasmius fiardii PR-910]